MAKSFRRSSHTLRSTSLSVEITAYNSRQHQQQQISASHLRIGNNPKLADWWIDDQRISEHQLTAYVKKEKRRNRIHLENHGRSIVLESGRRIHGGSSCTLDAPCFFWIGDTCFSVTPSSIRGNQNSLTTLPSFNGQVTSEELAKILGKSPAATTLIHWLQSIGTLQRSVGGSQEFFADAAHAVFDPGGLDCGMIITCTQDHYEIADAFISNPELGIGFDREVVKACIDKRQTVFHDVNTFEDPNCKLQNAVIASPIFDHQSKLIGVVYGSRCRSRNNFRQGIRPLEAQFIQVVAECVTAGMVRLAQEANAARTRVQFEQVFSPKLVEVLQRDPSILNGHEREVTVMFCDMRASSIVTDQLPPRELYHVLGDVMDHLTDHIIANDGVIIDYYGDGLAAFWNAPIEQENHAELAVQAGLDIINSLPELNENWRNILGRNIQVGIGINTGVALVGNSGSRSRMKYGPRGRNVNIACRIESATKEFGIPILVSDKTRQQIEKKFVTRRIFKTELKGHEGRFDLYQPFDPQMDVRDLERLRNYEEALDQFEKQQYLDVIEKLVEAELEGNNDAAVEYLLERTRDSIGATSSRPRKTTPNHRRVR